ncbi:MAG: T9SS type A sorting domain-containing protein [Bacteroidetes bacterium]|nr:T9SS type A sorting domain-containing protein [Bacteroidota bacterium]
MKRNLLNPTLIALGIAIMILSSGAAIFLPQSAQDFERENETDEPLEAIKQEFSKTRDPQLNVVPRERLIRALNYYGQQTLLQKTSKTTSTFSSITWLERGPNNVGGRTRAILWDANDATGKTVFAAGVGGGLWKCSDITATAPVWSVVNDQFSNLAITSIAQDPSNAQIMYFGTGEGYGNLDAIRGNGIWKSTNGGATWSQLSSTNNVSDFAYVQKIVVNSSGVVLAACSGTFSNTGGLQRSSNGGTSWTRVIGSGSTDMAISDVEIAANGDIYAATGIWTTGKVFKSTNGGTSFSNVSPSGSYWRIELATAPSNSSVVYAVCQGNSSNNVSAIQYTSNGGTSWTSQTIPTIYDQGSNSPYTRGQAWYDLLCAVDPNNASTVYIGGVDLLKSTNNGVSWTQITSWSLYNNPGNPLSPFPWGSSQNVHADHHAFVFKPGSSSTALNGNDGGIFYSTDLNAGAGLPTWASKSSGYNVTQYYACATHPTNANFFLGGAQDNGSHRLNSTSITSGTMVSGGDGAFCFISSANGNNQITSYTNNNYYYSINGGTSFSGVNGSDNSGRFINPSDLDGSNDILYSAGATNTLVRFASVFSGSANRTDLTVSIGSNQISAVKVSPNNASTVYVGTDDGNVYRITNANATPTVTLLTTTALGSGGYVSSIDVKKRTTNTDDSILVALSNYGINSVYYCANGTVASPTWVDIDDNSTLQDVPVRWAIWSPISSKIIFLGTEVGVLGTGTINGNSTVWTLLNNGILPNVRVDMIKVNSANQLVLATHGRGIWTSNDVSPLAIQLLAFHANLINNESVLLDWTVNQFQQNTSFSLERSYDAMVFEKINSQTSNNNLRYQFTDKDFDKVHDRIFYRLCMTDGKGEKQYSDIQSVILQNRTNVFIEKVYPTITQGKVSIKRGNTSAVTMHIKLIDALGKVYVDEVMPYQDTEYDLSRFSAGTYLLYITDEINSYKSFNRIIVR